MCARECALRPYVAAVRSRVSERRAQADRPRFHRILLGSAGAAVHSAAGCGSSRCWRGSSRADGEECGWAAAPVVRAVSLTSITRSLDCCSRTGDVSMQETKPSRLHGLTEFKKRDSFPRSREYSFSRRHTLIGTSIDQSNEKRRQNRIQTESWGLFSSRYNYWAIHRYNYWAIHSLSPYTAVDAEHRSERIRREENGVAYMGSFELSHRC
jgi:hypothetical protein